jgi:thiol-disulfide isomerase/thioredoxin
MAAVLLVGGCAAGKGAQPTASVGPPCLSTSSPAAGGTGALPDLTLPCFDGGAPVRLAGIRGPTVINFWASWCAPCRAELPQIERYAEHSADRVQVIGVITSDPDRRAARSIVDDFGLRFPNLYDEKAALRTKIGGLALPMTLLVDAQGRIVYTYLAKPLDEATLADLVQRHLGLPPA